MSRSCSSLTARCAMVCTRFSQIHTTTYTATIRVMRTHSGERASGRQAARGGDVGHHARAPRAQPVHLQHVLQGEEDQPRALRLPREGGLRGRQPHCQVAQGLLSIPFTLSISFTHSHCTPHHTQQGYERLCCLQCIQKGSSNYGTTCICRVPKDSLPDGKVVECVNCGCHGCASCD